MRWCRECSFPFFSSRFVENCNESTIRTLLLLLRSCSVAEKGHFLFIFNFPLAPEPFLEIFFGTVTISFGWSLTTAKKDFAKNLLGTWNYTTQCLKMTQKSLTFSIILRAKRAMFECPKNYSNIGNCFMRFFGRFQPLWESNGRRRSTI